MRISDLSSDVCSSDLGLVHVGRVGQARAHVLGQFSEGLHDLGMMERLLADAADHVHVDRFRALGELRESRLGSSAAHGGQRNGGGQEILLQAGSPGWFDSPSLSDGQRLLPALWSWSI